MLYSDGAFNKMINAPGPHFWYLDSVTPCICDFPDCKKDAQSNN